MYANQLAQWMKPIEISTVEKVLDSIWHNECTL